MGAEILPLKNYAKAVGPEHFGVALSRWGANDPDSERRQSSADPMAPWVPRLKIPPRRVSQSSPEGSFGSSQARRSSSDRKSNRTSPSSANLSSGSRYSRCSRSSGIAPQIRVSDPKRTDAPPFVCPPAYPRASAIRSTDVT